MSKTVEISEEDFLKSRQLAAVVGQITKNPKAKKLLQQAHKLIDPQAITPELDADEQDATRFKSFEDQISALKKQMDDEKAENEKQRTLAALSANVEKGIDKLRTQGWTEDGIKGVRELMEKKGLLDVDDAAALFERANPPPPPNTPTGSSSWNFFETPEDNGQDDLKQLIASKGDNEALSRKMISEALNEVRGVPRR